MTDILDKRVAIVTGGARGIGLAIAQTLVMEGARVVIADNGCGIDGGPQDSVVADAAVERLNAKSPGSAIAFKENLAQPDAAEACVALARANWGAIDIIVNNAAIQIDAPIHDTRRDQYEQVFATNLIAPYALLAAATPHMREQVKRGRIPGSIINIIAASGFIGNVHQSAFVAAKAGLMGLTRAVAMDLSAIGITCNSVAPFATTRLTQQFEPRTEAQRQYHGHALKVPASYVANLVAYLCTSYASRVTGQCFGVRAREVFLYHPPLPRMTVYTQPGGFDADSYAQYMQSLRGQYADLRTEYEVFNIDPLL